jgi:sulfate transport system ATP-binding protein
VTSVFVTHDQEEAMEVADRIVVMNQGRIEQDGPPDEVYDHPKTPFVLRFLGDVNLFHGRFGHAPGSRIDGIDNDEVGYVRPHELEIVAAAEPGTVAVTLSQVLTLGAQARIEFRRDDDGSYLDVEMPRTEFAKLRDRLGLVRHGRVHLKARRVTRFETARTTEREVDPAAMI